MSCCIYNKEEITIQEKGFDDQCLQGYQQGHFSNVMTFANKIDKDLQWRFCGESMLSKQC